jgi:hypothetical protein
MIGELVHDYALGRNGIVIRGAWIEVREPSDIMSCDIPWEWEVLYDDGELMGADTGDLKVINET